MIIKVLKILKIDYYIYFALSWTQLLYLAASNSNILSRTSLSLLSFDFEVAKEYFVVFNANLTNKTSVSTWITK